MFAIEPIGPIGRPYPEQHAFLSNEALLRAVPTHIQIVHPRTGEVIGEFGKRADRSDVVFSPTTAHVAILDYLIDSKTTIVNVWDVNAREQVSEWEIAARIGVSAFSPTEPLFAASFDDEIHLENLPHENQRKSNQRHHHRQELINTFGLTVNQFWQKCQDAGAAMHNRPVIISQ